jgi:DNA-binding response OmpR family regulator
MLPNNRSRVLCVDDDEDACEMLSELLSSFGIDATCARSAAAAWPLIKTERFHLFLLDAWLPGLDGFQFCRQLREFDSKTPILFYSGAAYDADKRKGIAAGATAYVAKPDVDGLISTMLELIAKAGAKDVAPLWSRKNVATAQKSLVPQFFTGKTACG